METSDARKRRVETSDDQGGHRGGESRSKAAFCGSGGTNHSDVTLGETFGRDVVRLQAPLVAEGGHPQARAWAKIALHLLDALEAAERDADNAVCEGANIGIFMRCEKRTDADEKPCSRALRAERERDDLRAEDDTWEERCVKALEDNRELRDKIARAEALAIEWMSGHASQRIADALRGDA